MNPPAMNPRFRRAADIMAAPTPAEMSGWRAVIRDERELVRLILTNQNTMRLAGLIPEWRAFAETSYAARMRQFLDPDMVDKMAAWWELCRAAHHSDKRLSHARLMYSWEFLLRIAMHERHGAAPSVPELPAGVTEAVAGELRDKVRSLKARLLLRS